MFPGFLAAAVAITLTTFSVMADDRCATARKELMGLKKELSGYVEALGRTHAQEDLALADVLSYKISDLIPRIKELERQLTDCPAPLTPSPAPGMAGTKSEEQIMAEKSCEELKKMMLPLIRKVNSLKRREKSVLSGLSSEEKGELSKAETDLRLVKEQIRKKCGSQPGAESLPRRLRR